MRMNARNTTQSSLLRQKPFLKGFLGGFHDLSPHTKFLALMKHSHDATVHVTLTLKVQVFIRAVSMPILVGTRPGMPPSLVPRSEIKRPGATPTTSTSSMLEWLKHTEQEVCSHQGVWGLFWNSKKMEITEADCRKVHLSRGYSCDMLGDDGAAKLVIGVEVNPGATTSQIKARVVTTGSIIFSKSIVVFTISGKLRCCHISG